VESTFNFKQFKVIQSDDVHKVGTDGVLLGAWTSMHLEKKILDVGTGTGLIALMAAQRTTATVTALEPHRESFCMAVKNVKESPWSNRINVFESSLQQFSTTKRFDLIVSNPPFFSNSLLPPSDSRKIHRHTNTLSFEDLAEAVAALLLPSGRFSIILPEQEALRFLDYAERQKLFPKRITEVRSKPSKPIERVLVELGFTAEFTQKDSLILLDEEGLKTEEYSRITRDFYL